MTRKWNARQVRNSDEVLRGLSGEVERLEAEKRVLEASLQAPTVGQDDVAISRRIAAINCELCRVSQRITYWKTKRQKGGRNYPLVLTKNSSEALRA